MNGGFIVNGIDTPFCSHGRELPQLIDAANAVLTNGPRISFSGTLTGDWSFVQALPPVQAKTAL